MPKPRIRVPAGRRITDNVVALDVVTSLDLPADRILDGARDADLGGVVILGWDRDGEEYFASSIADGADVLWLLERLKLELLTIQPQMSANVISDHTGTILPFPGSDDPS